MIHHQKLDPTGAAIFQVNKINTMAADALAPCVARPPATMLLNAK